MNCWDVSTITDMSYIFYNQGVTDSPPRDSLN
jgi:uncharacterized protein (DUF2164 family)